MSKKAAGEDPIRCSTIADSLEFKPSVFLEEAACAFFVQSGLAKDGITGATVERAMKLPIKFIGADRVIDKSVSNFAHAMRHCREWGT